MRISVKLYATLRRYKPELPRGAALTLDVPPGTAVGQVIQRLGIPDAVPLVAMVNNGVCKTDHILADGDKLNLFPPVAGG